jgi:hypothetical protein
MGAKAEERLYNIDQVILPHLADAIRNEMTSVRFEISTFDIFDQSAHNLFAIRIPPWLSSAIPLNARSELLDPSTLTETGNESLDLLMQIRNGWQSAYRIRLLQY